MSQPADTAPLRFEVRDAVATLTLDRPATRNALEPAMRDALAESFDRVRGDRTIRALVITGSGGAFCAGGDIRGMADGQRDAIAWRSRMKDAHAFLTDLMTLDRPVIAAVDGAAFGAGFSLALAADFVIATPRARFCMSFMRIGLVPDFGAFYTLPRVVGVQRAKELMLSAREVGVEEAKALGIVMEIVPAGELASRAQALAQSFTDASPTAVSLVKHALRAAPQSDLQTVFELEANAQAVAASDPEHRAAVERFLAKQPVKFRFPG